MESNNCEPIKRGLIPRPNPASGLGALLRPEVRISAIYTLLAAVWIISSDSWLDHEFHDPHKLAWLQTFKGLNFVITSGILLYLVLRRSYGGWRQAEESRLAVANAARECFRNLSNRLQTMREDERTRISREIHDELGQHLTGLRIQLRLIEDHLANRHELALHPLIDEVVAATSTVDDTIQSVRRIASGLRPPALDHLGLLEALTEEAEQFTRRTGILCQLDFAETGLKIPTEASTAAFRIFQESLTNVARHAKADRVDATCAVRDGTLVLNIRDNGMGMNPDLAYNPESLGLLGMKERATHAGGTLEFKGSAGNGTEVVLSIPLTNRDGGPIQNTLEDSHC